MKTRLQGKDTRILRELDSVLVEFSSFQPYFINNFFLSSGLRRSPWSPSIPPIYMLIMRSICRGFLKLDCLGESQYPSPATSSPSESSLRTAPSSTHGPPHPMLTEHYYYQANLYSQMWWAMCTAWGSP